MLFFQLFIWVAWGSWFCRPYSLQKNGHPLWQSSIHSEARVQGSSLEWVTTLYEVLFFPSLQLSFTEQERKVKNKNQANLFWMSGRRACPMCLGKSSQQKTNNPSPLCDMPRSIPSWISTPAMGRRCYALCKTSDQRMRTTGVCLSRILCGFWLVRVLDITWFWDEVRENWRFLLMQSLEKYRNPIWSFEMFEKPLRCFGDRSCCWKILVVRGFWRNAAPPAEAAHIRVLHCTGLHGNVEFTVCC